MKLKSVAQKFSEALYDIPTDIQIAELSIGGARAVFVRARSASLVSARVCQYYLGKFYLDRGVVRFADGYDAIASSRTEWRRVIGRSYAQCVRDIGENMLIQ